MTMTDWKWDRSFRVPEEANRFFFFNPFSLRILKEVLRHILDSWYENPRPMALLFYYPSDEYAALLARTIELDFQDELDCSALFPGNPRERILCYTLPGPEDAS